MHGLETLKRLNNDLTLYYRGQANHYQVLGQKAAAAGRFRRADELFAQADRLYAKAEAETRKQEQVA